MLKIIGGSLDGQGSILFDGGEPNLYGYVASDPVNLVDPVGAWTIGISVYVGIGGGISVSYDPGSGGLSGSFEIGVGAGVGLDYDPAGQPFNGDDYGGSQATVFAEVSASASAVASATLGAQVCEMPNKPGEFGDPKAKGKGCIMGVCVSSDGGVSAKGDPAKGVTTLKEGIKGGIGTKAGVKVAFDRL